MQLLAVDYGEAKIGLAISDEAGKIALPYKILENQGFNFVLSCLQEICHEEGIGKIIVGRPIGMKGQETVQTKKTDEFIKKLQNNLKVPIEPEDERLTSKAAEVLSGRGDHAVAAMIILQDWIERNT